MRSYDEIFKEFNDKKIKYIVIGGLALNLHGVPRMTYDIDILLDLTESNVVRFEKLMKAWGFKARIPAAINDIADPDKREYWIKQKNMRAFNLVNPAWTLSEIDVLIDSPVSFAQAKHRAKKITLKGMVIPVMGIKDLIRLKRASGRQQDLNDIENLRRVSREK